MLSNKTYDILNTITKYVLPLLSTLIMNLNYKLHFADNEIISLIFVQLIAFLNGLLGISSLWYYKEEGDKVIDTVKPVEKKQMFPSFPSIENRYFRRKEEGGCSPCIKGDKELYKGCTLNNCVGLAWGLFALAENNPDCKIGFIKSSSYPQDAGSWFNDGKQSKWDTYERGYEPRLGSVLCYSKHVVYVNEILDNGDLLVYSSSYGSDNPDGMEEVLIRKSTGYAWRNTLGGYFEGFIYPR